MSEIEDNLHMTDLKWRPRLIEAIENSGQSKRAISIAAGMGPGYVHSILAEGKDPTIENLIKICDQANISLAHVLFGYEISKDDEDLLIILKSLPKDAKEGLLKALQAAAKDTP